MTPRPVPGQSGQGTGSLPALAGINGPASGNRFCLIAFLRTVSQPWPAIESSAPGSRIGLSRYRPAFGRSVANAWYWRRSRRESYTIRPPSCESRLPPRGRHVMCRISSHRGSQAGSGQAHPIHCPQNVFRYLITFNRALSSPALTLWPTIQAAKARADCPFQTGSTPGDPSFFRSR